MLQVPQNDQYQSEEYIHEAEVSYIKEATSKVKLLIGKVNDKKINKEIEKVYDALKSSPTKSSHTVKYIEENIITKIEEFEIIITSQNLDKIQTLSTELCELVKERNEKLKQLN